MPDNPDARSPESLSPSREALFQLLTEEINDVIEIEKLKGWTPYVLIASLLSGSWVLIQDLFNARYSFRNVTVVFLLITFMLLLTLNIRHGLDTLAEGKRRTGLFLSPDSGNSSFVLLVESLWMAVIVYCSLRLRPWVSSRSLLPAVVFHAAAAIVFIIGIFVVSARLPTPRPHPRNQRIAVLIRMIIVALIEGTAIAGIFRSGIVHELSLVDTRVGGLIAFGALGIVYLADSGSETSYPRKELSEIRRDLVLGSISTMDGLQRTRVALQGMSLSDLFQRDMRELFALTSVARGEYSEALAKIFIFRASIGTADSENPRERELERLALGNMLEVMERHELQIHDILIRYTRLLASVKIRLNVMAKLYRAAGG